ncbi:mycothiol synthase [Cellulosimicrobium sp. PMB13]|uniref:mycothiol synthase n=1 Tax=Cellulosimicrobium sp. PMB13 TaxID=3120158 RepID=UPI003F4C344D
METSILWHPGPLIDDAEITQVHELAAAAERADGVAPLSEQPLLNLREADDDVVHLLSWWRGSLAGYAQVDRRGPVPSGELVVRPEHRRHGLGFHLLASATARAQERHDGAPSGQEGGGPPAALHVWAHGDLPAARSLAARSGFVPVRELLVLARPLGGPDEHPFPDVPADLRPRTFVPGADDAAWVRTNARAFAQHPEQGRLTVDDLRARTREDWFDARGLYLLEEEGGGDPVGFVWTKIPDALDAPTGAPHPEGEIYVVGVDPDAQGRGLGRLLTAVGLAHLARAGVREAVLYVDGDNTAALRTYERAGFSRRTADVQYAAAPPGPTGR